MKPYWSCESLGVVCGTRCVCASKPLGFLSVVGEDRPERAWSEPGRAVWYVGEDRPERAWSEPCRAELGRPCDTVEFPWCGWVGENIFDSGQNLPQQ